MTALREVRRKWVSLTGNAYVSVTIVHLNQVRSVEFQGTMLWCHCFRKNEIQVKKNKTLTDTPFSSRGKGTEALHFQQPRWSFICKLKHDKAAFRAGLLYFRAVGESQSSLHQHFSQINVTLISFVLMFQCTCGQFWCEQNLFDLLRCILVMYIMFTILHSSQHLHVPCSLHKGLFHTPSLFLLVRADKTYKLPISSVLRD